MQDPLNVTLHAPKYEAVVKQEDQICTMHNDPTPVILINDNADKWALKTHFCDKLHAMSSYLICFS